MPGTAMQGTSPHRTASQWTVLYSICNACPLLPLLHCTASHGSTGYPMRRWLCRWARRSWRRNVYVHGAEAIPGCASGPLRLHPAMRSGRAIALFLLFLALQTACPHLRWVRATSGPALTSQILNQAAHATPQKGTAPTDAPNPIYLESYHEYRTTEPASTYQFCSRFTSLLY